MVRGRRARVRVVAASVFCVAFARMAPAQAPAPALTAQDVQTFLDGMVPLQLRQQDIAGTVISIVKDGKLLFSRGYGYSDVRARTPVTTDATLFRIGSTSKTFTWTAVMQLVEQGKLDLDRDVNAYIDFRIPAPFGKPVTMRNLLTHTPGFEQPVKDMIVRDSAALRPLGTYLKAHLPLEIYPPGTTPSYSNYGATLAGYVVERVSGVPFNEYIRRNILQPLGMTRTTFDQPLPNEMKPMMSQGYAVASQPPRTFEDVQAWPAGSMSTTADAMSHYMIAHLQDGEYGGAHILKPETARLMHSRLFGISPSLNAMAYGFYEESRNGHRIIGHAGDTQWFHSDMHLMLDDHVGFFISSNSAGKGVDLRSVVWTGFLDRYYPYAPPAVAALPTALSDARSVAGTYMSSRRSETGLTAVFGLLQEDVRVNADSTISAGERDAAGNLKRFREVAPLVFREVNGQSRLAFAKDGNGTLVMSNDEPFIVSQRVGVLKNGHINIAMLMFSLGTFVVTLLGWPAAALLRKHYDAAPALPAAYRRARGFVRVASLAAVVFVVLFTTRFLTALQSDIAALSSSADGNVHLLQALGFFSLLGLPVAAFHSVASWRAAPLWVWTKIGNTLLLLAFASYVAFVLNWHLLNMNLNY
jgi:CubicO group peptidase (beta-lactamase class C family)